MATTNVTVTKDWTKVADDTDDPVLIRRTSASGSVEFAITDTDAAPTGIVGAKFLAEEGINRSNSGVGFIWLKVGAGSRNASTMVVVIK